MKITIDIEPNKGQTEHAVLKVISATAAALGVGTVVESRREPSPDDYVCSECGSDDIDHAMWVGVNTNEVGGVFGTWCEGDSNFCNGCDQHTYFIERREYDKKNKPKKKGRKK